MSDSGLTVVQQEPRTLTVADPRLTLLTAIAKAASDNKVDAAKMRELYELKKDIDDRASRDSFYRAMLAVQQEIQPIVKDAENSAVHNRYARLAAIDAALRPVYTKYGFALSFSTVPEGTKFAIQCEVLHRDGHAQTYKLPFVNDDTNRAKTALMATGSSVTYLRRYLTCMIFNAVFSNDGDDNDGVKIEPEKLEKIQALKAKLVDK